MCPAGPRGTRVDITTPVINTSDAGELLIQSSHCTELGKTLCFNANKLSNAKRVGTKYSHCQEVGLKGIPQTRNDLLKLQIDR